MLIELNICQSLIFTVSSHFDSKIHKFYLLSAGSLKCFIMSRQTDSNKTKDVVHEIKISNEVNKPAVEEVIISENEIRKLLDCSEDELEKLGK